VETGIPRRPFGYFTFDDELTALANKLARLFNITVRVKEWHGEVVFLHEVVPGAADRSYGIHVARLAGLPAAVIDRAEQVLSALEKGEQGGAVARLADDLPLFAAMAAVFLLLICLSPRRPSLAPSSTMAACGLSASAQSSRASPPALVSPDTPPLMTLTSIPRCLSARSSWGAKP